MKKSVLKTGLLTIGMLSVLSGNIKVYADDRVVKGSILQTEDEQLVQAYADVFEISRKTTMDKIKDLTGDFKSWKSKKITYNENTNNYDYVEVYTINDKDYTNEEIAILETVRDISKNPGNYDLTNEDIATDYEYSTDKCGEDILKYYCDLLGVNEYAALPIMYEECYTDLGSSAYVNQGNPAGIGPNYTFKNIEDGIIYYVYMLRDNYGFDENTDASVYGRIGSTYCTNTATWINRTNGYYSSIENNYYYYADQYEKEHTNKDKVIKLH